MDDAKKYEPPQPTTGDHLHTVARAGISLVPYISGPAVELFTAVISPPLQRRQAEWMEGMAAGLRAVEEKQEGFVDSLKNNEAFIDAVLQASSAAVRTSQHEKLEALRNAVLNSALPQAPDASEQAMFIQYADTLTVWHLRLLRLLTDPLPWFQQHKITPPQFLLTGSIERMIIGAFSELSGRSEFIEQCISDLQNRGLLRRFQYHTMMSGQGPFEQRATQHGRDFLAFVSAPQITR